MLRYFGGTAYCERSMVRPTVTQRYHTIHRQRLCTAKVLPRRPLAKTTDYETAARVPPSSEIGTALARGVAATAAASGELATRRRAVMIPIPPEGEREGARVSTSSYIEDGKVITPTTTIKSKQQQRRRTGPTHSLTDSQLAIIGAALQGKNLFLTGSAGTGKSYLTRAIVNRLRQQGKRVAVVASTGVAACNIGGVTLHSFCRLSPTGRTATVIDYFASKRVPVSPSAMKRAQFFMKGPLKALSQRTKNLDTLVIDEVSMLSAEVLEAAEITLRFAMWFHRSKSTTEHYTELPPFGGLQIIVVGDFLQLPPVSGQFCFKSPLWKRLQFENWNLQTPFRQNEPEFFKLLESIRLNRVTKAEVAELTKLCETSSDAEEENKDRHVVLRCTNVDVDRINASKLSELPTQKVFVAEDKNAKQAETVLNIALHKELTLAVGARVVLTRNLSVESGLVNGATGTIVAFSDDRDDGYPLVRFDKRFNGAKRRTSPVLIDLPVLIQPCEFIIKDPVTQKKIASRQQLPLRLAWALTVHRSQGMSIPFVDVDLTDAFAKGQGYVGISRAMSIRGLKLRGGHALIDAAHPSALQFYETTSFMQLPKKGVASSGNELMQQTQQPTSPHEEETQQPIKEEEAVQTAAVDASSFMDLKTNVVTSASQLKPPRHVIYAESFNQSTSPTMTISSAANSKSLPSKPLIVRAGVGFVPTCAFPHSPPN